MKRLLLVALVIALAGGAAWAEGAGGSLGVERVSPGGHTTTADTADGSNKFVVKNSNATTMFSVDTTGKAYVKTSACVGNTSPRSTLHVAGSLATRTKLVSGEPFEGDFVYMIEHSDSTIVGVPMEDDLYIILPPANTATGRQYTIAAFPASYDVYIGSLGGSAIDGETVPLNLMPLMSGTVVSDGTDWLIIGFVVPTGGAD